jgi:hypothetical protein
MHSRPTLSKRLPTALAVAAATLLTLPASGMAAETFGSRLVDTPNYGACDDPPAPLTAPCSWVSYIHPAAGTGDPYAGGAPNDGVITKFRIRALGPGASVTFRVANISTLPPDMAQASAVATGPTVTIAGLGETEEFQARVPVAKGNHLAIDTTDAQAIYETGGNEFTWGYGPALVDGAAPLTSATAHGELLVAAVVEPDIDKDGFGDETQDQCPGCPPAGPGGGGGGGGGADQAAPSLGGLAIGSGQLTYRLSEAASLTLKVQRVKKGRKVAGKCKRPKPANRGRKACKRYVKVGTVKANGVAGLNRLALPKKVGGRKLAKGRYRLTITARDGAGNVSAIKRIGYRIKR